MKWPGHRLVLELAVLGDLLPGHVEGDVRMGRRRLPAIVPGWPGRTADNVGEAAERRASLPGKRGMRLYRAGVQ